MIVGDGLMCFALDARILFLLFLFSTQDLFDYGSLYARSFLHGLVSSSSQNLRHGRLLGVETQSIQGGLEEAHPGRADANAR